MRRILLVIGLLLVGLLVWLTLRGGDDPDASRRSAREGTGAEAAGDDAAAAAAKRERAKKEEKARAKDAHLSAFLRSQESIGQDEPQKPDLGAIKGKVLAAPGVPARETIVTAWIRGKPVARARVEAGPPFLLKNVPPGGAVALDAVAEGYAAGGMERLFVEAGQTLDAGTLYLGAPIDPDATNVVRVLVTTNGQPVPGAVVTATSASYRALLGLGNLEKVPGGTVARGETDAAGACVFEKLPPSAYDVFAEAEGMSFEVDERVSIQRDTKTEIKLEMEPGLTIEGTVVAGAEKKPVEGARVFVMRFGGNFSNVPTVTTDAEGRFVAKGLTSGNHMMVVAKEDMGGKELQGIQAGTKDLVVEMSDGEHLWIRCTDAATGEPVKEFGVRPYRKSPFAYAFSPLFEAKTEDGVYKVKLLPAADYGAEVTSPGYAMQNVAKVVLNAPAPAEVKLEPSGMIRGKVVSKTTGQPIRGAQVFLKRGGMPPSPVKDQRTVTDAQGLFALDHLPRRAVSVWVSHIDHDEASFEGVEPAPHGPGQPLPEPREFRLGSGGTVRGVVKGPDGKPVAGQTVTVFRGFDFAAARRATTKADGTYEITHIPAGTNYTVSSGDFAPGRRGDSRSGVAIESDAVVVIDFAPVAGGQRVTGRVMQGETPVGGAQVSIVADDGGQFNAQERSSDAGVVAFENVPAGRFVVRAWGGRSSKPVSLTVKESEAPAEFVLELATGSLGGVVLDAASGQPLGGVWVQCDVVVTSEGGGLTDLVRRNRGGGVVDAAGRFSVKNLEDGSYQLRAQKDGYGIEVVGPFELKQGETRENLEIRLGPGCTVTGTVRNAKGDPVEGAALFVRDKDGRDLFSLAQVQSGSDGSYTQGSLRPETYELVFQKEGYAPATTRVVLTAAASVTADVTLYQGGKIDVTARKADGTAVKDALVTVYDASGKEVRQGLTMQTIFSTGRSTTDASGAVTVSGLGLGVYQVALRQKGSETPVVKGGVEVFEGGRTPVEFVVE
ncbi:MAG: hypothetical protein HMLKMBBP_02059 [Planctomycetes bacterium]|nr:hypothetical protein [Planctomycetota bacterium]